MRLIRRGSCLRVGSTVGATGRSDGSWARIRCSSSRSSGPGSSPSSSTSTPRAVWNVRSASTWRPWRYWAVISSAHQCSSTGSVTTSASSSAARRVEVLVGAHLDLEPAAPAPTAPLVRGERSRRGRARCRRCRRTDGRAPATRLIAAGNALRQGRRRLRRTPARAAPRTASRRSRPRGRRACSPDRRADLDRRDVSAQSRHLSLDRVRRGWPTRPQHVGRAARPTPGQEPLRPAPRAAAASACRAGSRRCRRRHGRQVDRGLRTAPLGDTTRDCSRSSPPVTGGTRRTVQPRLPQSNSSVS